MWVIEVMIIVTNYILIVGKKFSDQLLYVHIVGRATRKMINRRSIQPYLLKIWAALLLTTAAISPLSFFPAVACIFLRSLSKIVSLQPGTPERYIFNT